MTANKPNFNFDPEIIPEESQTLNKRKLKDKDRDKDYISELNNFEGVSGTNLGIGNESLPNFNSPTSTQYFDKTFSAMEDSIRDLNQSLMINKEMLKSVITSGIDDETLSVTFYQLAEENSRLTKTNHKLTKERDIALFKLDKMEFESVIAPSIPQSEDVRKNCNLRTIDVRRVAVNSPILRKENEVIESKDVELDHSNQRNNQELEEKIMKVCERMTVVNKHLEDDQDEMINFLKQNNGRNEPGEIERMSSQNLLKDQAISFNKSFYSSIQSKDSHSPVPRLNLSKLKYKKTDMNEYAEKLEESVKLLRSKLKLQMKEFDKLRFKYVKLANQNKALFELNEKLKNGLKEAKEKLAGQGNIKSPKTKNPENKVEDEDSKKCADCGCDMYLGFTKKTPSNIKICANNSSFFFSSKKKSIEESQMVKAPRRKHRDSKSSTNKL